MIIRDVSITVNGTKSTMSEEVHIYQGDFGIRLRFKISNRKYQFRQAVNLLTDFNTVSSQATVLNPQKLSFKRHCFIEDEFVVFEITQDMTDELKEIGEYKLQFHLFDSDGGRVTIPPVNFYVNELIANVTEGVESVAICGMAKCGEIICGEGLNNILSDDGYEDKKTFLNEEYIKRFGGN